MRIKRKIDGTVVRLQCSNCEATFFNFIFSGNKDTDSTGLYSLSSCNKNEIVLGEMESNEWNNFNNGGIPSFTSRTSKYLGRDDLKVTQLIRVEQKNDVATGTSFRDFIKTYQRPVQIFSCICCANGESRLVEELTVEQFLLKGGHISITGRLEF